MLPFAQKDALDKEIKSAIHLLSNGNKLITVKVETLRQFEDLTLEHFSNATVYQSFLHQTIASLDQKSKQDKLSNFYYLVAKRFDNEGKYIDAIQLFQKSEQLLDKIDYKKMTFAAALFADLGKINLRMNYYEIGKEYYFKSLNCPLQSSLQRINSLNSLGFIHSNSQVDSSFFYYKKALHLCQESGDKIWEPIIWGNLGFLYLQKKDTAKAIEYYGKDWLESRKNSEYESSFSASIELLKIYLNRKDYLLVEHHLCFCDSLRKILNTNDFNASYFGIESKYYEKKGNLSQAFLSYKEMTKYAQPGKNKIELEKYKQRLLQSNLQKSQAERIILEIKKQQLANRLLSFIVLAVILILFLTILFYQINKRKKREIEILNLKNQRIDENLKNNKEELKRVLKLVREKNEMIDHLSKEILEVNNLPSEKEKLLETLQSFRLLTDEDLIDYKRLFDKLHPNFTTELSKSFPEISNAELRLATLIKLNFTNMEMSRALGISNDSVRKTNLRLRKKLQLESTEALTEYIQNI